MRFIPFMISNSLLHRKITVEEPHKRIASSVPQLCQEYGNTKHIASCQQFALLWGTTWLPGVFCCKAVYETETKIRVRSGTKRVASPPLMAQATTKQTKIPDGFWCHKEHLQRISGCGGITRFIFRSLPTIVSIRIPQRYEQLTNMNVISHTNWLRFKKYLSSHCSESIRLRTPGDIELGIENISKMMNEAVHHASTTYQQPSFNRIFSADIQRLVSEKRRARREWQQHRSPQHKARLRECITQLRNLLASEKTASFKEYLENLDATSETNYSLWRAARNLKRPVQFKPPYAIQVRLGTKRLQKEALGIDGISNKMMIELPRVAVRILLFIFNAMLRLEYFPITEGCSGQDDTKAGKDLTKAES
ncbi:Probable RNA-directed DNA polymerase from transposon X-element [Eumeta japonica]|uniref:Probable RNA-directed DNA polymerase from transposon X-element n=1 Tax=Eumeta variegata TaxID=151549 RepID=A0A4C1T638_EUMVA|nr:Probable RNA-directed DNA polymerase from transposon X-element [Eumeta japonica]